MSAITLQKKLIDKSGGVVVLSLEEYERLRERAVPTYYLHGNDALSLDRSASRALREHRSGKSKTIRSLADLS
ncbi:hypothetical protein HY732_00040 [Candidatus Uhrbacteria bacterium]|nr:hypothetical protein [Candidatus Uhrbacteria bacterium]